MDETQPDETQLDDLCRSGAHALQVAKLTPLDEAIWNNVKWENAKEILTPKISTGQMDSQAVDKDLEPFISRIEGTTRGFQCMVPIYNSQGIPVHCGHQVQRKDRILRHVKNNHLHYRPFVCEGKCGNVDWYSGSWQGLGLLRTEGAPISDYTAADQRYLSDHIDPNLVPCGNWSVPAETSQARADVVLFQ
jgi:hypothetical protein